MAARTTTIRAGPLHVIHRAPLSFHDERTGRRHRIHDVTRITQGALLAAATLAVAATILLPSLQRRETT